MLRRTSSSKIVSPRDLYEDHLERMPDGATLALTPGSKQLWEGLAGAVFPLVFVATAGLAWQLLAGRTFSTTLFFCDALAMPLLVFLLRYSLREKRIRIQEGLLCVESKRAQWKVHVECRVEKIDAIELSDARVLFLDFPNATQELFALGEGRVPLGIKLVPAEAQRLQLALMQEVSRAKALLHEREQRRLIDEANRTDYRGARIAVDCEDVSQREGLEDDGDERDVDSGEHGA